MSLINRPKSLADVAERVLQGEDAGRAVKNFLHEFQVGSGFAMLSEKPPQLDGHVERGLMLDAFLQALAVYLAVKINSQPPSWTQPPIQLPDPWFASPGDSIRNYLLISSPASFRSRNLFVDEDSLSVV